jgi:hypothetical protein
LDGRSRALGGSLGRRADARSDETTAGAPKECTDRALDEDDLSRLMMCISARESKVDVHGIEQLAQSVSERAPKKEERVGVWFVQHREWMRIERRTS